MTDSTNPYQSPNFPPEIEPGPNWVLATIDKLAIVLWPVVFSLNMIVPGLIGSDFARHHAWIGVGWASAGLLASGWALCLYKPPLARKLILGSLFVALSQLFPILQLAAGMIAFGVAERLGVAGGGDDVQSPHISSEAGGFVVTLLVGSMLLSCASVVGVCLGFVLPGRWFDPNKSPPERNTLSALSHYEIGLLKAKRSGAKR